ncbi:hypothetical protein C0995_000709 [Termitomyces sp. Mi166|nr:hypothetical protein C0995_000709 [Termitomyces sp. Mi166\
MTTEVRRSLSGKEKVIKVYAAKFYESEIKSKVLEELGEMSKRLRYILKVVKSKIKEAWEAELKEVQCQIIEEVNNKLKEDDTSSSSSVCNPQDFHFGKNLLNHSFKTSHNDYDSQILKLFLEFAAFCFSSNVCAAHMLKSEKDGTSGMNSNKENSFLMMDDMANAIPNYIMSDSKDKNEALMEAPSTSDMQLSQLLIKVPSTSDISALDMHAVVPSSVLQPSQPLVAMVLMVQSLGLNEATSISKAPQPPTSDKNWSELLVSLKKHPSIPSAEAQKHKRQKTTKPHQVKPSCQPTNASKNMDELLISGKHIWKAPGTKEVIPLMVDANGKLLYKSNPKPALCKNSKDKENAQVSDFVLFTNRSLWNLSAKK